MNATRLIVCQAFSSHRNPRRSSMRLNGPTVCESLWMAFYTFVTACLQLQIQNTGLWLLSLSANLSVQVQIFILQVFTSELWVFTYGAVSVHNVCIHIRIFIVQVLEYCYSFTFI